jgi:hypothetical protein
MALLAEYALIPDVFDTRFYLHEEVGTARLEYIKDVFLEEALLRNLRAGEWLAVFRNHDRPWHQRGTELLKKTMAANGGWNFQLPNFSSFHFRPITLSWYMI